MGVTELFSEMLVVHRATLGSPRESIGSIWGPVGRRPHRSTGSWHPRFSQSKKEGVDSGFDARAEVTFQPQHVGAGICIDLDCIGSCGNQQTAEVSGKIFDVLELLSHCRAP